MRIKQITQKLNFNANKAINYRDAHGLPILFFFGLKLCYVSKILKQTSQQNPGTAIVRSDIP